MEKAIAAVIARGFGRIQDAAEYEEIRENDRISLLGLGRLAALSNASSSASMERSIRCI